MTAFSVSTAPFFVGSLPQALPTRVLLLPPAPLGDVALPTHLYETRATAKPVHASGSARCLPLPLCTRERCWHLLPTKPSCRPPPKVWDVPTAAAPLPHKSSWKFRKRGSQVILLLSSSSTAERRVQVLHQPNCSIPFLFNPQSILSEPQHFSKASGVGPPYFVFCKNSTVECLINKLKIRKQVYILPCMQQFLCVVPPVFASAGCA